MDEKTLKRLDYYKVLEKAARHCGSAIGREKVMALRPSTDPEAVARLLAETSEGRELLRLDPLARLDGWKDIRLPLARAARAGVLDPGELLDVAATLAALRRIKSFFAGRRDRYPLLSSLAGSLAVFPELEEEIKKAIDPGGEVSDGATPALSQIRRKKAQIQDQIKDHLENMVRSPVTQKFLQDQIVTVRGGRYVVPVKIEFRSQVPGIVHDQSASGATLFVEPLAVVEKNNELKRLEAAEREEVMKVLTGLSSKVAQKAGEIGTSLEALGELDFILARARYADETGAVEPVLTRGACFDIRRARHPLLEGGAVPVDIRLGLDFDALIVTGPNTGGKTVSLKTAGLFVLMAQSGLHLPADEGTRLGVFTQVFADVGDEQSIEQSLSTFSSHMSNIVEIVRRAGPGTLVLLDELGAGTDPAEGAALAQAILERLLAAGAKIIATTHHSDLKNFAYTTDRVENASVEFDALTLKPTYRLLTGRPGRSNAFEIAARLGLPAEVVARARDFMTAEQIRVEELMQSLERAQQEAEMHRREAAEMARQAASLKEKYEKMEAALREKKEAILSKAAQEARELVRSARREADAAVRELKEKLALESARQRENAVREARERLLKVQRRAEEVCPQKDDGGIIPSVLRPGDEVFLPEYGQRGYVLAPPGAGGEVQVQVGVLKISVPVKSLRVHGTTGGGGKAETAGVKAGSLVLNKAREISPELDLRGQYPDEAVILVDKYLDDACLAGLSRVYLIHGKGTGALRAAVHRQLKEHRRVKSFRLGEHGEGGLGVTVVDLE